MLPPPAEGRAKPWLGGRGEREGLGALGGLVGTPSLQVLENSSVLTSKTEFTGLRKMKSCGRGLAFGPPNPGLQQCCRNSAFLSLTTTGQCAGFSFQAAVPRVWQAYILTAQPPSKTESASCPIISKEVQKGKTRPEADAHCLIAQRPLSSHTWILYPPEPLPVVGDRFPKGKLRCLASRGKAHWAGKISAAHYTWQR